jgi:hypothetical protein
MNSNFAFFYHVLCLVSEPPEQRDVATGNGYDDVEELPVPEVPTSPGLSDKYLSPEKESGARYSQTGVSMALSPIVLLPHHVMEEFRPISPQLLFTK